MMKKSIKCVLTMLYSFIGWVGQYGDPVFSLIWVLYYDQINITWVTPVAVFTKICNCYSYKCPIKYTTAFFLPVEYLYNLIVNVVYETPKMT